MSLPLRKAQRPRQANPAQSKPPAPVLRFGMIFLILSMFSTLWSLASPLMSVPDEPAHTIKAAAVARGQFLGTSGQTQGEQLQVVVPKYIADTQSLTCFAFKVIVTADCSPGLDSADRQPTTAGTSAGNYNPLYYLVVGLPSTILSGEPAIYAMRILSGLLCSLFLAATLLATTQFANRRWPVAAAGIAVTPMVLYLCGSINPNALEIVATSAVFVNLCLVLENVRELSRFRFNIVVVGVAAAVLANTRALSLLWLALAVIAALLMVPPRDLLLLVKNKLVLAMAALIAVAAALGLLWLKTANTLASLLGTPGTVTPEQAFGTMVERTFDIAASYVAQLGWLDTNGPTGVYFWWSCLTGALMVAAVSVRLWRPRLGFIVLLAAAIAIPPILQAQVVTELGYIWQGRYLLPVIVPMLLAAGLALRFLRFPDSLFARRITMWAIGLTAAAHTAVFANALRRYGVGISTEANWADMFGATKWEPPLGWLPLALAYLAVTAVAGVLLYRQLSPGQPPAGEPINDGSSLS
ncbi:DUF2142 domain-containing protein [Arthrobacter sp. TE12232]